MWPTSLRQTYIITALCDFSNGTANTGTVLHKQSIHVPHSFPPTHTSTTYIGTVHKVPDAEVLLILRGVFEPQGLQAQQNLIHKISFTCIQRRVSVLILYYMCALLYFVPKYFCPNKFYLHLQGCLIIFPGKGFGEISIKHKI